MVKDATTERGVPRALVTAWSCPQTCGVVVRVTADESGRYSIRPVGANPFVIGAEASGYSVGYWSSPAGSTVEQATRLTIDRSRADIDIQLTRR
jgi:hypothetical protein